jgi:murein DD-endopeptidase MepM/ murein hydrolase activator NlpD
MGLPGDDRVAVQRSQRKGTPALRFGAGDAEVIPFRRRGESLAERLERERLERERADRERRARIERQREARERAAREAMERRRRERAEWLRREREELRRRERRAAAPGEAQRSIPSSSQVGVVASRPAPRSAAVPSRAPAAPETSPGVGGPVRKGVRAAESRRRAPARRKGLFWPTAKAGFAVTVVLGLSAELGTLIGLPVPGLDAGSARQSLAGTASLLPVDPGTPPGLRSGYVFPVLGPHDFGEAGARFGAERYGHTHEGQDVFAKPGTPLGAVRDGIVVDGTGGRSFYAYGGGNSVVIYSPDVDRSFVYLHMLHPARVRAGDRIHAGQVIGQVGCTGSCDGPHLHFEIRMGRVAYGHEGRPLDPLPFLREWPQPGVG